MIAATVRVGKTGKISIYRLPAPGCLLNHPPREVVSEVWLSFWGHEKSLTPWHVS